MLYDPTRAPVTAPTGPAFNIGSSQIVANQRSLMEAPLMQARIRGAGHDWHAPTTMGFCHLAVSAFDDGILAIRSYQTCPPLGIGLPSQTRPAGSISSDPCGARGRQKDAIMETISYRLPWTMWARSGGSAIPLRIGG